MIRSSATSAAVLGVLVTAIWWNSSALAQQSAVVNRGVVELETTGSDGISVRIAEDLARLVDDGATRRVVPVVGKNSLQNIIDLKYLRGVDLAVVQEDVLDYAKDQQTIPGIDALTYITRLYNEEFHLLTRSDVNSLGELSGQKINVDLPGSGTDVTSARLFDQLKLRVTFVHDSPQVALDKLRKGEIAGIAFVAGKPAPLFGGLTGEDGLHFLPIPLNPAQNNTYAPTRLTATDYPSLIKPDRPIDTVAVGSILIAADLHQIPDRYNNIVNFVEVFFTGFQSLLSPGYHQKWNDVNIAANVPKLRRFDPAAQWLQRNSQVNMVQDPNKIKDMFSKFIDERRQAAGGQPMTDVEKNALFQQFQNWQNTDKR